MRCFVKPSVPSWALAAAAVQVLGAALFAEAFPFSRYGMYADIATYRVAAVPVVLADGVRVDVHDYQDFAGLEPEQWGPPPGAGSSMEYALFDARRRIALRRGAGGDAVIELGHRVLAVRDGRLEQRLVIQQRGRGRRCR